MPVYAKMILIFIASIVLGIVSYYFFKGWFNIIPWILASLGAGFISENRRDTIINGAILGYFLFLAYILIGYEGKTDTKSILTILIFSLLFSLTGSVAGIIGALMGNVLRKKA